MTEQKKISPEELFKGSDVSSAEMPGGVFISWTIKMIHPDSGDPDFIRVEGHGAELAATVDEIRASLKQRGYREVGQRAPVAQTAPPPAEQQQEETGETEMEEVGRVRLERRTDGRYKLSLWGFLGDGRPMEYPFIYYTAEQEDMEKMLSNGGLEYLMVATMPVEGELKTVSYAEWKFGRKIRGKDTRYRDLVNMHKEVPNG